MHDPLMGSITPSHLVVGSAGFGGPILRSAKIKSVPQTSPFMTEGVILYQRAGAARCTRAHTRRVDAQSALRGERSTRTSAVRRLHGLAGAAYWCDPPITSESEQDVGSPFQYSG